MHIVVLSSCTSEKATETPRQLTIDDFERGGEHVQARERELRELMRPAEAMYTGQQQIRLMGAVRQCKASEWGTRIDLHILSAGYGLIPGSRHIAPYNCTFTGMNRKSAIRWADKLGVPTAFRKLSETNCDLIVLLLGADYLKACRLDSKVTLDSSTIAFCSKPDSERLANIRNLRTVSVPHSASKNIWLKGEYGGRLLRSLSRGAISTAEVMEPTFDVLSCLDKMHE